MEWGKILDLLMKLVAMNNSFLYLLKTKFDESTKNDINLMSKYILPVIGPVPNIIGFLEAFDTFKIITGAWDVILAQKVLNFDLLSNNPFNTIELK